MGAGKQPHPSRSAALSYRALGGLLMPQWHAWFYDADIAVCIFMLAILSASASALRARMGEPDD